MPCYEVRYYDGKQWEQVSETTVLERLQESYSMVTPVIQQLLDGKQVAARDAVYRISGYDNTFFSRKENFKILYDR
jgi:hypothetical protein